MNEKEFVNSIIPLFTDKFTVYREVSSECKSKRIDLVLQHKIYKKIVFGVECKMFNSKKGNEIGKYIRQAINYSDYKFVFGEYSQRMPILICPALSINYLIMAEERKIDENGKYWYKDRHEPTHQHHTVNGILGSLGIGEIRNLKSGNYYFTHSNYILFESNPTFYNTKNNHGVHFENYNNLINK